MNLQKKIDGNDPNLELFDANEKQAIVTHAKEELNGKHPNLRKMPDNQQQEIEQPIHRMKI